MYRYQKGFEKEGNVLFNDALNTFYLQIYGRKGRKYFYVTTYSTHFIYLASDTDIWCDIMAFVTPVVEHWLERKENGLGSGKL